MTSRRFGWAARLVLAGTMVTAGTAGASMSLQVDLPALARRSTSVVHAHVIDVRSAWNDQRTFIFTFVTLRVEEKFRGESPETVVVRVPGGRVGDFVAEMDGAPQFSLGEEIVAFLASWDDGTPMVAGYQQGLSRVEKDVLGNRILHGGKADGMPISELARAVGLIGQ